MSVRYISLVLLAVLLQGCFSKAFHGERAGVLVARDRRAEEVRRDDLNIEARSIELIYQQASVYMHVNVTSFNHKLLLSGEVPNEAIRGEIEKAVSSVEKVGEIHNELVVAENSSLLMRSSDSLISSKVKMKFVADGRFDANMIKVIVENGTVFLMGIVSREEAEAAAEDASTIPGVQRVVKLFEYLG